MHVDPRNPWNPCDQRTSAVDVLRVGISCGFRIDCRRLPKAPRGESVSRISRNPTESHGSHHNLIDSFNCQPGAENPWWIPQESYPLSPSPPSPAKECRRIPLDGSRINQGSTRGVSSICQGSWLENPSHSIRYVTEHLWRKTPENALKNPAGIRPQTDKSRSKQAGR